MRTLLALGIIIFANCGVVFAAVFDSSPLLPGSKIVAGDLEQNEFFILADAEAPQIPTQTKKVQPTLGSLSTAKAIKTAFKQKQTIHSKRIVFSKTESHPQAKKQSRQKAKLHKSLSLAFTKHSKIKIRTLRVAFYTPAIKGKK